MNYSPTDIATAHILAVYQANPEWELRSIYNGAWYANDRDQAYYAKRELVRRNLDVSNMGWPSLDISTWESY